MGMESSVGLRLKGVRGLFGWSQRELAKRSGVPNSAISVIEQDSVSPSISSLEKVLAGFPLKLADFFAMDIEGAQGVTHHNIRGNELTPSLTGQQNDSAGPPFTVQVFQAGDAPEDNGLHFSNNNGLLLVLSDQVACEFIGAVHTLSSGERLSIPPVTPFKTSPLSDSAKWVVIYTAS